MKLLTILGRRTGPKRERILASVNYGKDNDPGRVRKGDVIDDGKDRDITLGSGFPEFAARLMIEHLEARFTLKQWKFWTIPA